MDGNELPIVISASRRTDLASCYPGFFTEKLKEYPPEKVHSIVVWTKNPANLLKPGPLRASLSKYSQLYIHLTVTGLGNSVLEPKIPEWKEVVKMIPGILELVKSPDRITWRFDPIVRAETGGCVITNFNLFHEIAEQMRKYGISTCRTSWVEPYKKVIRRMEKRGVKLIISSDNERQEQAKKLEDDANKIGVNISYCSMENFHASRCIDGKLLSGLHPGGLLCSIKKAKGQRKLCGCTESVDIGWYSQKCLNGCLYCYAEPLPV
jgi:hypothetical protein